MPPAESRKSQTIRHATRPYSVEVGAVGASRMVVRDVLRGWAIERDPGVSVPGAARASDHVATPLGSSPHPEGETMPLIEVKLYDRRINDEVVPEVIAKLTDAICEVIGEDIRSHTWVLVEGLSPKQWGVGGKPTDVTQTTQATV
jgi:4-oxalocrotonate tautomerase